MNTPPKYPSTMHWPWSQTVHRDDSVHADPAMFVGRKVVITEKLDGGNTCLYRGDVYARSVTAPSTAGWMAMVKKHHAWKLTPDSGAADGWGENDTIIYGEDLYGIHSIEYDPILEHQTYRVFATRHDDMFSDWDDVADTAHRYGMLTVPVKARGKVFGSVQEITDWFETQIQHPSVLGGECEGFVMRIMESFHVCAFDLAVCKYVRPNHVQTDEHWTRNWQPCPLRKE